MAGSSQSDSSFFDENGRLKAGEYVRNFRDRYMPDPDDKKSGGGFQKGKAEDKNQYNDYGLDPDKD